MTQNQIAYQNLKETVRHNLATESISSTSNAINREHYGRADAAALSQAESAKRNADTNAYNASINYMNAVSNQEQANAALQNADSNRRNAATNEFNAQVNAKNADTNAYNAQVNARNAATNAQNAQTQAKQVQIQGSIAPSTIAANYGKAEQSKASAFESKVNSYAEHPVTASLVATGAVDQVTKVGSTVVGGITNFFTNTGEPSPVTIGIGLGAVKPVKAKTTHSGGGRRSKNSGTRSTTERSNVVYD